MSVGLRGSGLPPVFHSNWIPLTRLQTRQIATNTTANKTASQYRSAHIYSLANALHSVVWCAQSCSNHSQFFSIQGNLHTMHQSKSLSSAKPLVTCRRSHPFFALCANPISSTGPNQRNTQHPVHFNLTTHL